MDTPASFSPDTANANVDEQDCARAPGAARPDARAGEAPAASPRLVIRGESSEATPPTPQTTLAAAALTDWLNVTFRIADDATTEAFFERFSEVTAGVFGGMTDRERGLHGWHASFVFDRGKVMFARGGQRGTALLSMPAEGCAFVPDWERLKRFLRDELAGRITRWDGAADDFFGKHSVDLAVELYKIGGFNSGGRQPKPVLHGNWLTPDDLGRTFEVGRRKNGKLARIYEKGKQFGCPLNPWVRWEVELHSIDRHIPWDALTSPGVFVSGAYPCFSWVSERASRIRTVKTQDEISYAQLKQAGSLAYGALINLMLEREGSAERVVQLLRREGVPKRLAFTDDHLRITGGRDGV